MHIGTSSLCAYMNHVQVQTVNYPTLLFLGFGIFMNYVLNNTFFWIGFVYFSLWIYKRGLISDNLKVIMGIPWIIQEDTTIHKSLWSWTFLSIRLARGLAMFLVKSQCRKAGILKGHSDDIFVNNIRRERQLFSSASSKGLGSIPLQCSPARNLG